tara:strand:+ start:724 stop:1155 length:432 start_codon:yes stop_codon:yes gene_type:complete
MTTKTKPSENSLVADSPKPWQFQPGVSGNPGGRPGGLAARVREATKDGQDPIDFLIRVLRNSPKLPQLSLSHRIDAAKELLDRGFGKSVQYSEDVTPNRRPLQGVTLQQINLILSIPEEKLLKLVEGMTDEVPVLDEGSGGEA